MNGIIKLLERNIISFIDDCISFLPKQRKSIQHGRCETSVVQAHALNNNIITPAVN